jgi:histidine kinase
MPSARLSTADSESRFSEPCSQENPQFRCSASDPAARKELDVRDACGTKTEHPSHDKSLFPWRPLLIDAFLQYRSAEVQAVKDWWDGQLTNCGSAPANSSLLCVTGPAGAGKLRIVQHALHQCHGLGSGGYIVRGTHDWLRRPEPYAGLVAAFADFTHQVVYRGPDAIESMKSKIRLVVGDDEDKCSVLIRLFPSLRQILGANGKERCENYAKGDDAIQRFVFIFTLFLQGISSREAPLVVLLDNFHWADPCSVDLVARTVSKQIPGLYIVVTGDESTLCDTFCDRTPVFVRVPALDDDAVQRITDAALHDGWDRRDVKDLVSTVSSQTKRSFSCILDFFQWMTDQDMLMFDTELGHWHWDCDAVRRALDTSHHLNFLTAKLRELPEKMLDLLKVAACFGSEIHEALLSTVVGYPVERAIATAASLHVLAVDDTTGHVTFLNNGIHKAVYQLIPEDNREAFHLEVGRRLCRGLSKDELESSVFSVLSQLYVGERLLSIESERYAIANLCFHAGIKAAKLSTFRMAHVYLKLGITLLGRRGWCDAYDLTLATFNSAAEMSMCTAQFDEMELYIESIQKEARHPDDRVQAQLTKMYSMGMNDHQSEALDLGIAILSEHGVRFSRWNSYQIAVLPELLSVHFLLKGWSNEQLLRLPTMTDAKALACIQILHLVRMR